MMTETDVRQILDHVYSGGRINRQQAMALYLSPQLLEIAAAANFIRRRYCSDQTVTFIIDRNINYTNFCVAACSFCAFKRNLGDEEGYVIPWGLLDEKCAELVACGGTQVLLQGGMNPDLGIEYYQELISRIQTRFPPLVVHGFSPAEVWYLARISKMTVKACLQALKDAGLQSLPGGGGEILVDRVRKIVSKGKVSTDQWFDVMESAQELGLNTTATMMYGHVETIAERIESLFRIRESQDKLGGYQAFIAWDFQPDNTPLGIEMRSHPEQYHLGTGYDYLRMMAVGRLVCDNIPNFQVSWVTQGPKLAQAALFFGANDFGGTMMEENVVSAAGTTHTGEVDINGTIRLIQDAGFRAAQRDTFYHIIKRYEPARPGDVEGIT